MVRKAAAAQCISLALVDATLSPAQVGLGRLGQ
jgi:hypothetical protein